MNDVLQFPTVVLKSFSRNKNGGHAVFSSTFPRSIGDRMGWSGFPDGATSVKLEGELAARNMKLTPKDGPLSKWTTTFEITKVSDFQAFRFEAEGTRGKSYRFELRFAVAFADVEGCRYLEEYMTNAGEAKASLEVSYTKQAEQASLADADGITLDDTRRLAPLAEAD
jgi:hypothetical protein